MRVREGERENQKNSRTQEGPKVPKTSTFFSHRRNQKKVGDPHFAGPSKNRKVPKKLDDIYFTHGPSDSGRGLRETTRCSSPPGPPWAGAAAAAAARVGFVSLGVCRLFPIGAGLCVRGFVCERPFHTTNPGTAAGAACGFGSGILPKLQKKDKILYFKVPYVVFKGGGRKNVQTLYLRVQECRILATKSVPVLDCTKIFFVFQNSPHATGAHCKAYVISYLLHQPHGHCVLRAGTM